MKFNQIDSIKYLFFLLKIELKLIELILDDYFDYNLLNCCFFIVLVIKFNQIDSIIKSSSYFFLLNINLKLIESSLLIFDDYFDYNLLNCCFFIVLVMKFNQIDSIKFLFFY